VEGVLFDAEYLPILAEKMGKEDQIWEITRRGIQGAIDWEEGLVSRVRALRGMDYNTCKEVADSLPIMTGAREACRTLKAAGWKILAVSGGFTIMTDRLKKDLGLDYVYSNKLVFRDGKLDGVEINVGADKAQAAREKILEWGERQEDIVVTVDGANDLKLFEICGLGIAFRAQDKVKDMADVVLEEKDLSKILGIVERRYNMVFEIPQVA
jgi:phosphoserine phosphatase